MNRFYCFIGCLLLLFVVACGAPKVVEETKKVPTTDANGWESDRVYFQAVGTEPFWSISISEDAITWTTPESKIQFPGSTPMQAMDANVKRYVSEDVKGNRLELQMVQKSCSDGMSDQDYAYQVKVQLSQKETTTFQGCGNYLLHEKLAGKWQLQTSTPTDKPIVLELDATEMTFAGNAHCNRYFGSLFTEKNSLRLYNIGSTKIACNEKDKELIYLESLQKITHFSLIKNELVLKNNDGIVLKFTNVNN